MTDPSPTPAAPTTLLGEADIAEWLHRGCPCLMSPTPKRSKRYCVNWREVQRIAERVKPLMDEVAPRALDAYLESMWEELESLAAGYSREASPKVYPCADCGVLRSKDEGGTTFTVCDECWDKYHPEKKEITREALWKRFQELAEDWHPNKVAWAFIEWLTIEHSVVPRHREGLVSHPEPDVCRWIGCMMQGPHIHNTPGPIRGDHQGGVR